MKHVLRLLLAPVLVASLSLNACAADLQAGDPAPKLQTGKFVQGEPVKEFAPGKAYIVEFWATWCLPCRASIPHLNEFYKKYKDKGLMVIGQDCWEQDDSLVAPFVESMGEKMTYRVALDEKPGSRKGKMADTWMEASGQSLIPTAFLIDTTGRIAWIGHPMELKEKYIEEVLAGTFNPKEAAVEQAKEKAQAEAQFALLKPAEDKLRAAIQAKDWDAALSALDEVSRLAPDLQPERVAMTRLKILTSKKDYAAFYKLLGEMSEAHKDNSALQNRLAWMIVSEKSVERPGLELAQTLAQRALDKAKVSTNTSQALDTMARVKFLQGSKKEAITLELQAVDLAAASDKDKIQKALESYQKGELPEVE